MMNNNLLCYLVLFAHLFINMMLIFMKFAQQQTVIFSGNVLTPFLGTSCRYREGLTMLHPEPSNFHPIKHQCLNEYQLTLRNEPQGASTYA